MSWIKMRTNLKNDPDVIRIGALTGQGITTVLGALYLLWSWADEHTRDGYAPGVTREWIDRYVECERFSDALEKVGWLTVTDDGIQIPNFERHNGSSAKKRSSAQKRMTAMRERRYAASVTTASPDKIREDKKIQTPLVFPSTLDTAEFRTAWEEWTAYRRETRHALTPRTIQAQLEKLSQHPVATAVATLRASIANGWQGLFPEKAGETRGTHQFKPRPGDDPNINYAEAYAEYTKPRPPKS